MNTFVICPICNKSFNQLTNSHLKSHGLTTAQFKEQFFGYSLVSEYNLNVNKINSNSKQKIISSKDEGKRRRHQAMLLYLASPKFCKLCNNQIPYDRRRNNFCNHSCSQIFYNTGKKISIETKQKLSTWAKANPSGAILKRKLGLPINSPSCIKIGRKNNPRQIITRTCYNCNIEYTTTVDVKIKFCSIQCRRKHLGGYHSNSTVVHKTIYNNQQMDSGAELVFAKMLDSENIKWYKNMSTFFVFIKQSGKQGKYYPDFFLPDFNLWVEIKGKRYLRSDDNARLASVGNIIRIMSTELKHKSEVLQRITDYTISPLNFN